MTIESENVKIDFEKTSLVKIKDIEYLNTNYRYGYPGGQAVMVYKIHSLDHDNFLVPVFEKIILDDSIILFH